MRMIFEQSSDVRFAVVIDDVPEVGRLIARLCGTRGLQAEQFTDPRHVDAELLARSEVIFLDLSMPGLDGVELMRQFGAENLQTPIVLVSSHQGSIIEAAAAAGRENGLRIHGTLHKPFTRGDFEQTLASLATIMTPRVDAAVTGQELREAIDEGRLVPFFQPKFRLGDYSVTGFEALARLVDREGGIVTPDRFIHVADAHDMLDDLTDAMLRSTLDAWRDWHAAGHDFSFSVNVPASRLHDLHFPDQLEALYAEYHISRDRLILEITETQLMENYEHSMDCLARLALRRVPLSVDDFGTGFSSLSQLRRLPCVEMKIDRSFVQDMEKSSYSQVIVRKSIELGDDLGLTVCAEGIETEGQAEMLRSMGCRVGQGYLVGRPASRTDTEARYITR